MCLVKRLQHISAYRIGLIFKFFEKRVKWYIVLKKEGGGGGLSPTFMVK